MRKTTCLDEVKKQSKILLNIVPIVSDIRFPFIAQHPFTNSTHSFLPKEGMIDLRNEDSYKKWIREMERMIDIWDLDRIFLMVNNPWNLTWLKYIKPYLSKEDFSRMLRDSWIEEENPNMDANVSIATAIKWFKEADKKYLMSDEEYSYWESLPEELTLYRGVSVGRKKYGLSWTDDKEVAKWFQQRFAHGKKQGALLMAKINKKHCLCYFNGRNEREIVLDVNAIKKDIQEITNNT